MDYIFRVMGEPKGKGRPRFSRKTGRAFTPKDTASYENLVRLAFCEAYPDHKPIEGAVGLTVMAYFPIPQSWSKKKKALAAEEKVAKVTKPDLDNVVKAVSDGLAVAWKDDAQIIRIQAYKEYSDTPRVDVIITEVEEHEQS